MSSLLKKKEKKKIDFVSNKVPFTKLQKTLTKIEQITAILTLLLTLRLFNPNNVEMSIISILHVPIKAVTWNYI